MFGSRVQIVCYYGSKHIQKLTKNTHAFIVCEIPFSVKDARHIIKQKWKWQWMSILHVFSEKSLPVFLAQRVCCAQNIYSCYANIQSAPGYEKIVLSALYKALLLWQERRLKVYQSMARYVLVDPYGVRTPVVPRLYPGEFYRMKFPPHQLPKRKGEGTFEVTNYKAPPRPDLMVCPYKTVEVPQGNVPIRNLERLDQRMMLVRDYFRNHAHPPTKSGLYIFRDKVDGYDLRYRFYTSVMDRSGFKPFKSSVQPKGWRNPQGIDKRAPRFRRR